MVGDQTPMTETYIILVPTRTSSNIPALIKYGNWNSCPSPAVHVALMRSWNMRFGTELMTLTRDTIEMIVERPPIDRGEAIELAKEHYLYCPDTIEQGFGTIDRLAASLLNGRIWHFWWD